MTTCKKHSKSPVKGYSQCAGCEIEALRAENGRMRKDKDDIKLRLTKQQQASYVAEVRMAELGNQLEAARGLLRDTKDGLDEYWMTTDEGIAVVMQIDAFLTATQAPEERQDEDAWQTLHALSKAPQDGEKMTAERLHAICEVGHDRKAFVARLAEQVER